MKSTSLTDPTSMPATRTGAPALSPAMLRKTVFTRILLPEEAALTAEQEDQRRRQDDGDD